jgi:hypothetical protein
MSCGNLPTSCRKQLIKPIGLPFGTGQRGAVQFASNTAWYFGNNLGTDASTLSLYAAAAQQYQYVPGQDALNFTVVTYDALGSLVIGSQDVVRIRICLLTSSLCDDISSLVLVGFYPFEAGTGLCSVALKQTVVCSLTNNQSIVASMSLVMSTAVNPLTVKIQCLPCRSGQARTNNYALGTWSCVSCNAGEYVVDPNDVAYPCVQCPQGASCERGVMRSRVSGAVWVADPSIRQNRLIRCPEVSFNLFQTGRGLLKFSIVYSVTCFD